MGVEGLKDYFREAELAYDPHAEASVLAIVRLNNHGFRRNLYLEDSSLI